MAAELQAAGNTGTTCDFLVRSAIGAIWNGAALVTYVTANYATYIIPATEQGVASGYFTANMPAVIAGDYNVVMKQRVISGTPAESDPVIANGDLRWDGAAVVGYPFAITSNVKQNQALANFEFLMTSSSTHAPATGLTVTCTRSIDGGTFASGTLANVTEVGSGMYRVDFGAGDLNGKVIVLRATATGADDTLERLVSQP